MKKLSEMTYKEFNDYCKERACDGRWSFQKAINCIEIIKKINNIKVKIFGITLKKQTEQAREKAWQNLKKEIKIMKDKCEYQIITYASDSWQKYFACTKERDGRDFAECDYNAKYCICENKK